MYSVSCTHWLQEEPRTKQCNKAEACNWQAGVIAINKPTNRFILKFNIHGSLHRSNLVVMTNKMQLGNGIYYFSVYQKLNMFRAVCRSSSGAPTVFACSGLHTHEVTARSQV